MRISQFVDGITADFMRYLKRRRSCQLELESRPPSRNGYARSAPPGADHRGHSTLSPRQRHSRADYGHPIRKFVAKGLFDAPNPYEHQAEAIRRTMAGEHIVVTAGTGSGKTECFLLPIVLRLMLEARRERWASVPRPAPSRWFRGDGSPFEAQRRGEDPSKRPAAVRALVIYPMNALVEDQIRRLRSGLDSRDALGWLDTNLGGNRFYFGRYTGRTPVPGNATNKTRMQEYRRQCRAAWRNAESLRVREAAAIAAGSDATLREIAKERT